MGTGFGVAIEREMSLEFRRGVTGATSSVKTDDDGDRCGIRRRMAALRMVDRQLSKGNLKMALTLVKQLRRQPPPVGLRGFAAARQVPRRVSSVEELNLCPNEASVIQSLLDSILDSIKSSLQSSSLEEVSLLELERSKIDENDDLYFQDDIIEHKQVVHHEAGHFLVGYLLGILPRKYTFSSTQDADACVQFVGFEFLKEIEDANLSTKNLHAAKPGRRANKRKVSSTVLCRFLCVIVGGLVAEHLTFGYAKGYHADVEKMDVVLKWLQFTEEEAKTLMRWATLNTLLILRRHGEATAALAEAMARRRSIGNCIEAIEATLNHHRDI